MCHENYVRMVIFNGWYSPGKHSWGFDWINSLGEWTNNIWKYINQQKKGTLIHNQNLIKWHPTCNSLTIFSVIILSGLFAPLPKGGPIMLGCPNGCPWVDWGVGLLIWLGFGLPIGFWAELGVWTCPFDCGPIWPAKSTVNHPHFYQFKPSCAYFYFIKNAILPPLWWKPK